MDTEDSESPDMPEQPYIHFSTCNIMSFLVCGIAGLSVESCIRFRQLVRTVYPLEDTGLKSSHVVVCIGLPDMSRVPSKFCWECSESSHPTRIAVSGNISVPDPDFMKS